MDIFYQIVKLLMIFNCGFIPIKNGSVYLIVKLSILGCFLCLNMMFGDVHFVKGYMYLKKEMISQL